jgi:hypothetical protein
MPKTTAVPAMAPAIHPRDTPSRRDTYPLVEFMNVAKAVIAGLLAIGFERRKQLWKNVIR